MANLTSTKVTKRLARVGIPEREEAIELLKQYLSHNKEITQLDIRKLWQGIFYCYWLTDRQHIQDAVADEFTRCMHLIPDPSTALGYLDGFYEVMLQKWGQIDKWRIAKYMTLIRKFVQQTFVFFDKHNYDEELMKQYTEIAKNRLYNTSVSQYGVPMFIIEIILREMRRYCSKEKLTSKALFTFLEPIILLFATTDRAFVKKCITENILEVLVKYDPEVDKKELSIFPKKKQITLPVDKKAFADLFTDYLTPGKYKFPKENIPEINLWKRKFMEEVKKNLNSEDLLDLYAQELAEVEQKKKESEKKSKNKQKESKAIEEESKDEEDEENEEKDVDEYMDPEEILQQLEGEDEEENEEEEEQKEEGEEEDEEEGEEEMEEEGEVEVKEDEEEMEENEEEEEQKEEGEEEGEEEVKEDEEEMEEEGEGEVEMEKDDEEGEEEMEGDEEEMNDTEETKEDESVNILQVKRKPKTDEKVNVLQVRRKPTKTTPVDEESEEENEVDEEMDETPAIDEGSEDEEDEENDIEEDNEVNEEENEDDEEENEEENEDDDEEKIHVLQVKKSKEGMPVHVHQVRRKSKDDKPVHVLQVRRRPKKDENVNILQVKRKKKKEEEEENKQIETVDEKDEVVEASVDEEEEIRRARKKAKNRRKRLQKKEKMRQKKQEQNEKQKKEQNEEQNKEQNEEQKEVQPKKNLKRKREERDAKPKSVKFNLKKNTTKIFHNTEIVPHSPIPTTKPVKGLLKVRDEPEKEMNPKKKKQSSRPKKKAKLSK